MFRIWQHISRWKDEDEDEVRQQMTQNRVRSTSPVGWGFRVLAGLLRKQSQSCRCTTNVSSVAQRCAERWTTGPVSLHCSLEHTFFNDLLCIHLPSPCHRYWEAAPQHDASTTMLHLTDSWVRRIKRMLSSACTLWLDFCPKSSLMQQSAKYTSNNKYWCY